VLKFCEVTEVNDAVVSEGLRPVLLIDVIESPEEELRNTNSRYVVLGWTVKVLVVDEVPLRVVSVTLAADASLHTTVEVIPVPQVLLEALLLASPP
jgi:hypothetical protein